MIKSSDLKNFLFLILFVITFSTCNIYKPVEIGDFNGLKLESISNEGLKFKLLVQIKNPNSYSIKITNYELELSADKQLIGNIVSSEKVSINRNSNEIVEFPVDIKFTEIFSQKTITLIKIFRQNKINLKVKGFIKVRAMLVSKKINIEEEKIINISNKK